MVPTISIGFLRYKKKEGKKYWYYVENRIGEKQFQKYLGSADSILKKIKEKRL